MSKQIRRVNVPLSTSIRFVDKRTTIKETLPDGTINFYDLSNTLLCDGYVTNLVRGILQKVESETESYYTFAFNNGRTTHYRNFYKKRV